MSWRKSENRKLQEMREGRSEAGVAEIITSKGLCELLERRLLLFCATGRKSATYFGLGSVADEMLRWQVRGPLQKGPLAYSHLGRRTLRHALTPNSIAISRSRASRCSSLSLLSLSLFFLIAPLPTLRKRSYTHSRFMITTFSNGRGQLSRHSLNGDHFQN